MNLNIKIDVTPGSVRRVAVLLATTLIMSAAAVAYATQHVFASGDTLKAADLNNNFSELYARVAALESGPVYTNPGNNKGYSLAAAYCGVTASSYHGNIKDQVAGAVNGYAAAKTLCEAAPGCSSSANTAHMCTPEEIVRSVATGVPVPGGWYATGIEVTSYPFSGYVSWLDCNGFTADAAYPLGGSIWNNQAQSSLASCDEPHPILCCN